MTKGFFYCTPFVFRFVTVEGFGGSNGYLMPIYAKKRAADHTLVDFLADEPSRRTSAIADNPMAFKNELHINFSKDSALMCLENTFCTAGDFNTHSFLFMTL